VDTQSSAVVLVECSGAHLRSPPTTTEPDAQSGTTHWRGRDLANDAGEMPSILVSGVRDAQASVTHKELCAVVRNTHRLAARTAQLVHGHVKALTNASHGGTDAESKNLRHVALCERVM